MNVLQRFKAIISREPYRFSFRGFGKLFAIFQLFCMFIILPKMLTFIWPAIISNFSQKFIFVFGIMITNFITLTTYNLIFLVIYKTKHPFFEKYKAFQGSWPWQDDYSKWRKQLNKSLIWTGINVLIVSPLFTAADSQSYFFFKFSMEQIPQAFTIIWQVFVFMLAQDFIFYMGHSLLHHSKFYWIHKQHHEYNKTISIATQYSHPLQFIINSIAFGVGYKVLNTFYPVHMFAVIVWTVFRIIETTEGHSGYEWTFSYTSVFPIGGGPQYHHFHHSKNAGNYGSYFIFWDTLFGTNKQYFKWKRQTAIKQKKFINETQKID